MELAQPQLLLATTLTSFAIIPRRDMPRGIGESFRHKFTGKQRRVSSEMNKRDAELSWGAVQSSTRKVLPAPL